MFRGSIIITCVLILFSCKKYEKPIEHDVEKLIQESKISMIRVRNFNSVKTFLYAGNEIDEIFNVIKRCKEITNRGEGSPLPDLWVIESLYVGCYGISHVSSIYVSEDQGCIELEGSVDDLVKIENWFFEKWRNEEFGPIHGHGKKKNIKQLSF